MVDNTTSNSSEDDEVSDASSECRMQMEDTVIPVLQRIIDKPPSEPPPLLENSKPPPDEAQQWIENVHYVATTALINRDNQYVAYLCSHYYTPAIKKLVHNSAINEQHLSVKRTEFKHQH